MYDLVGVAKLLLDYGANINTHSNEFKESALTLACYKGHLDMVKFLLDAGIVKDKYSYRQSGECTDYYCIVYYLN